MKNGGSVASTAYITVLGVTTIKFFADITYVEDPTPRVFGDILAETCQFTPETSHHGEVRDENESPTIVGLCT